MIRRRTSIRRRGRAMQLQLQLALAALCLASSILFASSQSSPDAPVDCGEFQSETVLSGRRSAEFRFEWTVHLPGHGDGVELSPEEIAAGGSYTGRITYLKPGYVAIGVSPTGTMMNGEVVMCLPDEGTVLKYYTKYSATSFFPDSKQTLLKTSVSQVDNVTTCTFTKLLEEDGEVPINGNGENQFIWAAGIDNTVGLHNARGVEKLTFDGCGAPLQATEAPAIADESAEATIDELADTTNAESANHPTEAPSGGAAFPAPLGAGIFLTFGVVLLC